MMRMTIDIDDELLTKASNLASELDHSTVVNEGLKALIDRDSTRRLARLAGTQRTLKAAPRRHAKGQK